MLKLKSIAKLTVLCMYLNETNRTTIFSTYVKPDAIYLHTRKSTAIVLEEPTN